VCAYTKLLLFLVVISSQVAYSKSVSNDSSFYDRALNSSREYLTKSLETGRNLYNGIEHPGYIRGIKGFAYLDSDQMEIGKVKYDGVWYTVPMLYDLHIEKVVITHFLKFTKISLINEKVDEFVLNGHLFRNLKTEEAGNNRPRDWLKCCMRATRYRFSQKRGNFSMNAQAQTVWSVSLSATFSIICCWVDSFIR